MTADDYRFDTKNLKHVAYECPKLHDKLHAYMDAFGLNFACFDIIISKTGPAIFLECNPNGQWLWVENLTGLPIGKTIANELFGILNVQNDAARCQVGSRADLELNWHQPARRYFPRIDGT